MLLGVPKAICLQAEQASVPLLLLTGQVFLPDQLGDPLLSLLQFSYIFLALWDPALDAVSCCGLIITSLDLLPLQLSLFKQSRKLLAFIPSRAQCSHSAYGGLSFDKLVGFRKTLK